MNDDSTVDVDWSAPALASTCPFSDRVVSIISWVLEFLLLHELGVHVLKSASFHVGICFATGLLSAEEVVSDLGGCSSTGIGSIFTIAACTGCSLIFAAAAFVE